MKTIKINESITLTASKKVIDRWEREQEAYRAEQREYEALKEAERMATLTGEGWDYYSDLFKDIYGIRPRW